MSDHHHHSHDHSGPIAISATAARVVIGLLTVIGIAVMIGLVWLWPSKQSIDIPLPMQNATGGAWETEAGTVVSQSLGPCGSPSQGKVFADEPQPPRTAAYECTRSIVGIDSGPDEGNRTLFEIAEGPGQPKLHVGDHIRIVRQTDPTGQTMYGFDDFARGFPLAVIAIVFAVVIIAVARWRGLRALVGLVFAFGVLVVFMLPALLDGKPAIPVALVAGSLILYAVLYLAHGVNLRTSSALLGTLASMVLAAVLSWVTLEMTHLTGLSEEQNTTVATYLQHVSITGLLLAGFIIGSLGVLNDVTITQASAAFELAALDENATRRGIFAAAMRVGRDHIASTVYTLVLAYAGGALPLLLLFSVANRPIRDVLVGDAVGIEIARSAVGGICLALSVPLTTAIAVMLARPFGGRAAAKPAPEKRAAASSRAAKSGAIVGGARAGTPRPKTGLAANAPRTGETPRMPRTSRAGETPRSRKDGDLLAAGETPQSGRMDDDRFATGETPRGAWMDDDSDAGAPQRGSRSGGVPDSGQSPWGSPRASGRPGSAEAQGLPGAHRTGEIPSSASNAPRPGEDSYTTGSWDAFSLPEPDWDDDATPPTGMPIVPPEDTDPPRHGRHSRD